ncbi:MAG: tripartite tricarboxylate transporter permease [Spirochaetales bacterium]|nr:tripartite tricarboxylate transporter permease [Spirochaetales bacterium]
MDFFLSLLSQVFTPLNLLLVVAGSTWGLVAGSLPGVSSSMAVILLLPFTYRLGIMSSIIMMIAVYVGGSAGGSVSAILMKTPGTPEAVATTFDGYPLAMQGKSGEALGLAITASSFGSIFSGICMMIFAPVLSAAALKFQSGEYFALALLGLSCVSSIGSKNQGKAIISALLGLLVACVGIDPISGVERYTFNQSALVSGVEYIPVIIGSFALAELFTRIKKYSPDAAVEEATKVSLKLLKFKELFKMWFTFIRSAIIGTMIGIMPAAGGTIASLVGYGAAVKSDKHPERFGTGAYEGIIAPEASNNAAVGGSMVPTLTLGIPGSATSAVIMTVLTIQGLTPGPLLIRNQPELLYGIFISIILASLLLFVVGRFITRQFARVLKLPYPLLATTISLLGVVGAFALRGSIFDLKVMLVFGVVGYLFNLFGYSAPAFVLALILGKLAETGLRQQTVINHGSFAGLFTRPVSCIIIIVAVFVFVSPFMKPFFQKLKKRSSKNA